MTEEVRCELCGEPMPKGEEMFKYHGYSGPCAKPPQRVRAQDEVQDGAGDGVQNKALTAVLRQIVSSLPQKRDWLDPAVEREARALLDAMGA